MSNAIQQTVDYLIQKKDYEKLYNLVLQDKVTSQQLIFKISLFFASNGAFYQLRDFISEKKIEIDGVDRIVDELISRKEEYCLYQLIDQQAIKYRGSSSSESSSSYDSFNLNQKNDDYQKETEIYNKIINHLIQQKQDQYLYCLLRDGKIATEQHKNNIIESLCINKSFQYLYLLILNKIITKDEEISTIVDLMIENKQYDYLYQLIQNNIIEDTENVSSSSYSCSSYDSSTSSESDSSYQYRNNFEKIIVNMGIDKDYNHLYLLVMGNKITRENEILNVIDMFIFEITKDITFSSQSSLTISSYNNEENSYGNDSQEGDSYYQECSEYLYQFIMKDKIKDEQRIVIILEAMYIKKDCDHLYLFVLNDKITDKNIILKITYLLQRQNKNDYLYQLIDKGKIDQADFSSISSESCSSYI